MTVYFIQEQGGDNLIKIGKADVFQRRFTQVAASREYSLKVLGLMDGDEREEKLLHKVFSSYRREGEWFEPHPSILEFIENHTLSEAMVLPEVIAFHRAPPVSQPKSGIIFKSIDNVRYGPDSAERDFVDPDIFQAVKQSTDISNFNDGSTVGWYAVARPIVREFSKRMAPGTARKHVNRAYYQIYGKLPPSVEANRRNGAGAPGGNTNAANKDR